MSLSTTHKNMASNSLVISELSICVTSRVGYYYYYCYYYYCCCCYCALEKFVGRSYDGRWPVLQLTLNLGLGCRCSSIAFVNRKQCCHIAGFRYNMFKQTFPSERRFIHFSYDVRYNKQSKDTKCYVN
jgi:hypothetical protein